MNTRTYRILVHKYLGKCPLERKRRRWEDKIKRDPREIGCYDRG
jgi:hypothetical protein